MTHVTPITTTRDLNVLRFQQVSDAAALLDEDYSDSPRWRWNDLYDLTGPMLPGNLVVVGALPGNGKTALMLSQLDYLAREGYAVLYAPLELDARQMRAQWAAWTLGYPWEAIARNAWGELPIGARDKMVVQYREQIPQNVFFAPDRRLGIPALYEWVADVADHLAPSKQQLGVVIIDHFHRMAHGASDNYRVTVSEAARGLKDLAREYRVPVICTAQLNRSGAHAVLDRYLPPQPERLKETSALHEEADVVVMLSRRLRADADTTDLKAIVQGHQSVRDLEDPGVMQATIRKHRLDDRSRDRTALLQVVDGRVVDRWQR